MGLDSVGGNGGLVSRRLEIGRRISEYISKSHNARVRYNAYDCFVKLIETNKSDFVSVWKHRRGIPRKRREGEEFVNSLRAQTGPEKNGAGRLAMRLLWLLEEVDAQRAADEGETVVARESPITLNSPNALRARARARA